MSKTELVLSTLIEKLVFEPGPPISWEMTGIARPTVPESGDMATKLLVKVSAVESAYNRASRRACETQRAVTASTQRRL